MELITDKTPELSGGDQLSQYGCNFLVPVFRLYFKEKLHMQI